MPTRRQELPGLLRQVEQDRAGLEQAAAVFLVLNGRHGRIRTDGEVAIRKFSILTFLHMLDAIGQAGFVQHDRNSTDVRAGALLGV